MIHARPSHSKPNTRRTTEPSEMPKMDRKLGIAMLVGGAVAVTLLVLMIIFVVVPAMERFSGDFLVHPNQKAATGYREHYESIDTGIKMDFKNGKPVIEPYCQGMPMENLERFVNY